MGQACPSIAHGKEDKTLTSSVSPLDLGRKILGDLGSGPIDYSRLKNGNILLSKVEVEK